MTDAGQVALERATWLLEAAQSRPGAAGMRTRTIATGLSPEDDRMLYLIEAHSRDAVRRLLAVALLPDGRIREITLVVGGRLLLARHPGGDVDPGAETELVEDVVDVGLDGSLGQE
jgi:hypothetical protein